MIATLPHNPVDWNDIQVSIQELEVILQTCIKQFQNYPQVICIARSDGDRYTNPELVSKLIKIILYHILFYLFFYLFIYLFCFV